MVSHDVMVAEMEAIGNSLDGLSTRHGAHRDHA
jgi:hypothetical protein